MTDAQPAGQGWRSPSGSAFVTPLIHWAASLAVTIFGTVCSAQPQPGTVLWSCETGLAVETSPSVGPDGTVYVAAGLWHFGICAVTNLNGVASNKWSRGLAVLGPPAIGPDGTLYMVSEGEKLHAVNPDGTEKWTFDAQGAHGAVALGFDGSSYFLGEFGNFVYCVTSSGGFKWKSQIFNEAGFKYPGPVIGLDGSLYLGTFSRNNFYAFESDGKWKWFWEGPTSFDDSSAVGKDGTIYATAGALMAFSPSGGRSLVNTVQSFRSSPVIGSDGTFYMIDPNQHLFALSPSGQVLWIASVGKGYNPLNEPLITSPAVDAAENIYHCASNSVWAVSSQGQVLWSIYMGQDTMASPTIGPDGTLYVAFGSKLYAIATGTNGPANSPWPMYRGNWRHTGKVEQTTLQRPQKRADSNFEFQLFSQPGKALSIESSTDLTQWTTLTNFVPTTAPETVVDLTASNSPAKFYRAKGGG